MKRAIWAMMLAMAGGIAVAAFVPPAPSATAQPSASVTK